jgi:polyisoprenoid-binding protein YceI
VVRAQSSLHAVESAASGLTGTISADPDALESTFEASIECPMSNMSFGDRLRDWRLHSHLQTKQWPVARFEVTELQVVERDPWRVQISGDLVYRGQREHLEMNATGSFDDATLQASADFTLNLSQLGLTPPRFLFLKMHDSLEVHVELYAHLAGC